MKSAVDRDSITGKTRTLCGLFVDKYSHTADNPEGGYEVTCGNCLKIIKAWDGI